MQMLTAGAAYLSLDRAGAMAVFKLSSFTTFI